MDDYGFKSTASLNVPDTQAFRSSLIKETGACGSDETALYRRNPAEAAAPPKLVHRSNTAQIKEIISEYVHAYSLFNSQGRQRVYRTVKNSGPAYERQAQDSDYPNPHASRFSGWRMGVLLSVIVFGICLILELAMLGGALTSVTDGKNTLFVGSCDEVQSIVAKLAIPVNIIATLMTAASNYAMQCLSSPSRAELDRAHSHGKSLEVGLSTPSNAPWLSPRKTFLWWLLALSSVPVHLLFNSAFFGTQQMNDYGVVLVTPDFLDQSKWGNCSQISELSPLDHIGLNQTCQIYNQMTSTNTSSYSYLSQTDCLMAYSDTITTKRSNVLAVVSQNSSQYPPISEFPAFLGYLSSLDYFSLVSFYSGNTSDTQAYSEDDWSNSHIFSDWICPSAEDGSCNKAELLASVQQSHQWRITPFDFNVEYCYSQETSERCDVGFSRSILSIVIVCDAIKLSIAVYILFAMQQAPLTTIGDVISSYLQTPDRTTAAMCLLTRKHKAVKARSIAKLCHWKSSTSADTALGAEKSDVVFSAGAERWNDAAMRKRMGQAASTGRWFVFGIWIVSILVFLSYSFRWSSYGVGSAWLHISLFQTDWEALLGPGFSGFGPTFFYTTDRRGTSVFQATLMVNLPHAAFSVFYLLYNGLFTVMHMAHEFSNYATKRKVLRVAFPARGQRSSYYLSLPWTYSIPLVAVSSLIHWLISRAFFVQRLVIYDCDQQPTSSTGNAHVGTSALPNMIVLCLLVFLLVVLVAFGSRRLNGRIPLVGASSAAISAACHSLSKDPSDEPYRPLMWGVVREQGEDGTPGHCAFSSGEVTRPVDGHVYA